MLALPRRTTRKILGLCSCRKGAAPKAIWIPRAGDADVLQVREAPDPTPRAGEVRVQVRAAGLNFADMMARQGLYPDAPPLPCVVGYEVAGHIDAVGAGVEGLAPGTRVIALTRFGGHSSAVCVPATQVLPMPEAMSFEEGAALPVNYLTAFHMLFRVAAVRPGERVLIHMAAGGVGIAVLQLCRTIAGVETFGTASASKHAAIVAHGCTHPIDYHTQDYAAEIRRITHDKGVDVVLDALGGADWKRGYDLLRPAGRLVAFGFANMASGETRNVLRLARQAVSIPIFTPLGLMDTNRSVAGVNVGHLWSETEMLVGELKELLSLYNEGKIKPLVDSSFPFEKAADAHRRLGERRNIGKVVLVP
jgi:NADPH:quinone reductase-like Zn-dependent oxidoreductase